MLEDNTIFVYNITAHQNRDTYCTFEIASHLSLSLLWVYWLTSSQNTHAAIVVYPERIVWTSLCLQWWQRVLWQFIRIFKWAI